MPTYELWLNIYLTQIFPEYELPSEKDDNTTLECNEMLKDQNLVEKLHHICDIVVMDH